MATLSKKLTQVLYVGTAPLTLSALPSGVKSAIKLIRQVNAGGTGYASFNPASGVNSLTTAPAATPTLVGQYIVETVSASPNVNLGADFALAPPSRLVATFAAGQTALAVPLPLVFADEAGTYALDATNTTGLTGLSYANNSGPVTLPVTRSLNDGFIATGTTQAGVVGQLVFVKQ